MLVPFDLTLPLDILLQKKFNGVFQKESNVFKESELIDS